jgi:hypothetical protein
MGDEGEVHGVGEDAANFLGFVGGGVLEAGLVLGEELVAGGEVVLACDQGVGGEAFVRRSSFSANDL